MLRLIQKDKMDLLKGGCLDRKAGRDGFLLLYLKKKEIKL
jgi:hypothetical protein